MGYIFMLQSNGLQLPDRTANRHRHIFNQTLAQLSDWLETQNQRNYKAKQILHWVHHEGLLNPDHMTNLSKPLRTALKQSFDWNLPEFTQTTISQDGCVKWLLRLPDKNQVETVFIPETSRGTLCISSQSGCALACSFCATGAQGFSGNLTMGEVISQVWMARHCLKEIYPDQPPKITNIVLMGMGEPLLNASATTEAMEIMMHDLAYGLSKYRVTLSTSGIVPAMYELSKNSDCALAVSLHAPNDPLRDELVPINKKYPLAELIGCCQQYYNKSPKRKVTFEYAMLMGVNDQVHHAKQLIQRLAKCPCKINLIPFNPFPGTIYECTPMQQIHAFQRVLQNAGFQTTIRKTRGQDIAAACGQLAGQVLDMTKRTPAGQMRRKLKQPKRCN